MTKIKQWLIYLMLMVSKLDKEKALAAVQRFFTSREVAKSLEESFLAPELAEYFFQHQDLAASVIDEKIGNWSREGVINLLRCIKDEDTWKSVVSYLDLKDEVKLAVSGEDLKDMGIKPGPIYSDVLAELYKMKLDGKIKSRDEELNMLTRMLEEGKFIDEHN